MNDLFSLMIKHNPAKINEILQELMIAGNTTEFLEGMKKLVEFTDDFLQRNKYDDDGK